tara:strand:+ start:374 stop:535 length:162 start_codon:yes stop_codon:yes gene_type:complete
MQYNIYIDDEFKDRIDPALLEAIEADFKGKIIEVKPVVGGPLYDYRDIYLKSQ